MAFAPSTKSRLWIGGSILLVIVAAVLYFVLPSSRDRIAVRAATVERDVPIVNVVPTNGRVEPLVDFQAHAPNPSTVAQLYVHLGQVVNRGQELLKLDDSDAALRVANARNSVQLTGQDVRNMSSGGTNDELLGERADLIGAQTQLRESTASLGSLKALQAQGAASANEIAAAQQRLTDAQNRVNQIQTRMKGRFGSGDLANGRSQVARAQQELTAAQSNLAGLDIHTPIGGTVYALPIAHYDYVNPGEALISIADLHRLQVRAFFDEPEIGNLAAGEPVKIVWDAKPDHVWHGRVTQAPTTITNVGSRNVGECLISVDDADGDLLPNTNVTVTVTTMQRTGVLSLPREALHTEGASNFVYRIINDKLVRTPVTVGVVNLTRVEIVSGLARGETVALGATTDTDLQDGLLVRTEQR
ncbi:MAG: efflux RND transporter periplasmic adaptor subunit [Janthinobacterium lividum]